MFYASQTMPIPLQSAVESANLSGKRGSIKDGFSKILDRSMHALQKADNGKQQGKHRAGFTVSSLNKAEPRVEVQTRVKCSNSPVDEKAISGNEKSIFCAGSGEQDRTETTNIESAPTAVRSEQDNELVREPIELLQQLQLLLNDILVLLQKLYQSLNEPDSLEKSSANFSLEEFKQQILVKLTEAVELIKTSEIPELENAFADKLLQMLENGLLEAESIGQEQISIELINDLDGLVRKMLFETETLKLQIAEDIPAEFTAGHTAQSAEDIEHAEQSEPLNTDGNKPLAEPAAGESRKKGSDSETRMHQEQSPVNISKVSAAAEDDTKQDFIVNTAGTPAEIPNETASIAQTADKPPATGLRQTEQFEYQVIRQVIEKAETLLSENRTEMVIRLKPESLGKLTLRVIHERGEITAGLIAENEQVKAVIESNLRFLEDSLRRSGVELQSLAVSVGQNGQSGQNESDERSYNGRTIGRKTPVPSPAPINDAHHTYRFGGTAEGLIQMEGPAIDLTA